MIPPKIRYTCHLTYKFIKPIIYMSCLDCGAISLSSTFESISLGTFVPTRDLPFYRKCHFVTILNSLCEEGS